MINTQASDKAIRDQAVAWLLRLRDEPGNVASQQAFAEWLAVNPAHRLAYQQVEKHWAWMQPLQTESFRARDAALCYRPPKRRPLWRRMAVYATAASVLLGVGLALFSSQGWYGLPHTYSTGKGQRQTIVLSDGSTLELNTETEMQVRFNHFQRHVELVRGEAFFNVVHNSERPFQVHVDKLNILDIGTAFNVYKQAEQVNIAVQEGMVDIQTGNASKQLSAGQQVSYTDAEGFMPVASADMDVATAWRQGQLLFRGRRLIEVLAEIGRYHAAQIRLTDPKLANLRVNGSFPTAQLETMLNAVVTLLPVKVKRISQQEIVLEAVSAGEKKQ